MAKILIELDEDDLRQVEATAEVEDRSRAAQIRIIIAEWLHWRKKTELKEGS